MHNNTVEYTEENKPVLSDEQFDKFLLLLTEISKAIKTTNSIELAATWMRVIQKNTPSKIHSNAASRAEDSLFNVLSDLEGRLL